MYSIVHNACHGQPCGFLVVFCVRTEMSCVSGYPHTHEVCVYKWWWLLLLRLLLCSFASPVCRVHSPATRGFVFHCHKLPQSSCDMLRQCRSMSLSMTFPFAVTLLGPDQRPCAIRGPETWPLSWCLCCLHSSVVAAVVP